MTIEQIAAELRARVDIIRALRSLVGTSSKAAAVLAALTDEQLIACVVTAALVRAPRHSLEQGGQAVAQAERPAEVHCWLQPWQASKALADLTGKPPVNRAYWSRWAKRGDVRGWQDPVTREWFIAPEEVARFAMHGTPDRGLGRQGRR